MELFLKFNNPPLFLSQSIAKSSKKKAGSKRKHLSASFKEEEVSEEEEPEKGEVRN